MTKVTLHRSSFAFWCALMLLAVTGNGRAQTTTFTYQGSLTTGGTLANGSYDLQFKLYDQLTGGAPQGSPNTVTVPGVTVAAGVFTVELDFGAAAFSGAARYLEISVRPAGSSGYSTLAPRQQLTSAPYAIRSLSAASTDTATTAASFTGTLAGDVTGTQAATTVASVGGATASNVASGATAANAATSANTPSTIVKRDPSGNFSAGTITAALNGNATTATIATNFSGSLAGDVTGAQSATVVSTVGGVNASNVASGATTANNATDANTANTIVKRDANGNFSAGTINGNVVNAATQFNLGGSRILSGPGTGNLFAGANTGTTNTTGSNNTLVGNGADVGAGNLNYATALGAGATVSSSNTVVLGRAADTAQVPGNLTVSGTLTANVNGSATTATNFTGSLAGDVTGTQSATVVSTVGGVTASNVASGATLANNATNTNTASAIVKRDASGNFSAGTITAALNGNASTATSATAASNFSGSLAGDVTGTQSATVVSMVGGVSASNVASGATEANNATSSNTPSAIIKRDASGNFSAGTITASLNGNATTATTASGVSSTSGDSVITAINAGSTTINAARIDLTGKAAGGDLAGTYPNPSIATTAAAGANIVAAINASSSVINGANLPSSLAYLNGTNTFTGANTFNLGLSANNQRITNVATPTMATDAVNKSYVDSIAGGTGYVQFAPASQQTTSSTNHLINLKLNGAGTLGTSGTNDLLSLSAAGTYSTGALDQEWFRVDNAGGVLALGTYSFDGFNDTRGAGSIPATGDGARMMWYGGKAAFRAGYALNGGWDDANIGYSSFAGGVNNKVSGNYSVAFGADNNVTGAKSFAVGGNNTVTSVDGAAFGSQNTIGGNTCTALGSQNIIGTSGNSGCFTFGLLSIANASQAYAIGERANVVNSRAMVISLGPSFGVNTSDAGSGTFSVRAANGIWLGTNTGTASITSGHFIETSTGAYLTSGGTWTNSSDRNLKEGFAPVDGESLLRRLATVPMTTWKYRVEGQNVRHLGPMAQDFHAAFGLGDSDKTITTVDEGGVALAAAQALEARTSAQQSRVDAIERQMRAKDAEIEGLKQQVKQQQAVIDGMRQLLCAQNPQAAVCQQKELK